MESVTLKVPKAVMNTIRKLHGSEAVEWLEYYLVQEFKAYIEAIGSSPKDLMQLLNLEDTFNAILDP
jgi:hypothetical protein